MQRQKLPMNRAPQCGARTRSRKPCQSPAVRGKRRCRMHGGAAGSGAPLGNKNAFRHGHYSAEAIARRRELSELIRLARDTLAELETRGRERERAQRAYPTPRNMGDLLEAARAEGEWPESGPKNPQQTGE